MKKVLSFVLSVAMVICLMPAMAFANDDTTTSAKATGLSQFSDADSIKNVEAVAVLVGLGIVDGMGDGTFQPAGDLTRAQASKLVATLVKSGDKSDIAAPSADPFTDVAKDYWGAGAIQFGVDNGYINGMGDGTFHPEDQVTTAQLATMLLKVLGYSVADINYNWPENAIAYATQIGLLVEIPKGSNDALNREEAAQMMFEALQSTDVVKSTRTGSDDVEGINSYVPVLNNAALDYEGRDGKNNRPSDNTEQLIEKYFPKVTHMQEDFDAFMHPEIQWKNGREKITDEVIIDPAYTYTSAKTEKELKAELEGYQFSITEAYFNGDEIAAPNDFAALKELTGNGTVVELYTNEKDNAFEKVIVSDYQAATVTSVDTKNKEVVLDDDIPVVEEDDAYDALSSLAKDDKVLVALNKDDVVLDAYVPTEVTGTVTKVTDKSDVVTLGGKNYESAKTLMLNNEKIEVIKKAAKAKEDGIGYLDKFGYIKDYAKEKPADLEVADWLLVKDVYSNTYRTTADKYGDGSKVVTDYYVLAINEDGEIADYKLNTKDEGDKGATEETIATFDWVCEALADAGEASPGPDGGSVVGKFYTPGVLVTYTETADGYTIRATDPKDLSKKSSDEITQEEVKANAKAIGSNYVSTDVKTITVTGDKASEVKVTVTEGLSKLAQGTQYILKESGKNKLVTVVFSEKKPAADKETAKVIKLEVNNETDYLVTNYTDKDGNIKPAYTVPYYDEESADPKDITITTVPVTGWFTYKTVVEGVYELAPYATGADKTNFIGSGIIEKTYNGNITVGGKVYAIDSDIAVRDLREDGTATAIADLVPKMKVEFAYTTDKETGTNTIKQIYISGISE